MVQGSSQLSVKFKDRTNVVNWRLICAIPIRLFNATYIDSDYDIFTDDFDDIIVFFAVAQFSGYCTILHLVYSSYNSSFKVGEDRDTSLPSYLNSDDLFRYDICFNQIFNIHSH